MATICDGRIVVVTGAGRGLGRSHALELARQGARVVVNDLGCELDGSGGGTGPAGEVVEEIRAAGGEAVANGDDVADFDGAARIVQAAVDAFGAACRTVVISARIAMAISAGDLPPSLRPIGAWMRAVSRSSNPASRNRCRRLAWVFLLPSAPI